MRIMKSSCLILRTLGALVFICVSGFAQSPCPGTFDYQGDGYSMYGVINIQPIGPVSYVNVKANFTIAGILRTPYYGNIVPLFSDSRPTLNRILLRGEPIKYRVNFPVPMPLPRLTSLLVNGKLLCYGPGDVPGPNEYVTTINLEHVLNVNSGSGYMNALTDFVVPEGFVEPKPLYSPTDDKGPVGFTDVFSTVPVATSVDTVRQRPNIQISGPVAIERVQPIETVMNLEDLFQQAKPVRPEINQVEPITPEPTFECGVPSLGVNPLILQGEAYLRGDWPWVVAIFKRNVQQLMFICSGSLVSDSHIITAAHCIYVRDIVTRTSDIVVKVGAYDLDDISDDISKNIYVSNATAHTSYDPHTLKNDILILTLQKKVVYNNYISPVCLWSEDRTDLSLIVNKKGVVTGWGANEFTEPGRGKPRKASIPVVSTETCKASKEDFHKLTSDMTLCAGDKRGTGPCNGDSGGGLYMKEPGDKRWRLRGVVSVSLHSDDGEYVCNVQEYIVFTDTAKYLPWIKSIMSMP